MFAKLHGWNITATSSRTRIYINCCKTVSPWLHCTLVWSVAIPLTAAFTLFSFFLTNHWFFCPLQFFCLQNIWEIRILEHANIGEFWKSLPEKRWTKEKRGKYGAVVTIFGWIIKEQMSSSWHQHPKVLNVQMSCKDELRKCSIIFHVSPYMYIAAWRLTAMCMVAAWLASS